MEALDLGEAVITHPFFSLHNCLHRAKENFNLSVNQNQKLLFSCLKPWIEIESIENLNDIMGIIGECWSIHSVPGEYRLIQSVNHEGFQKLHRKGRLANNLRVWLNNI